jgi:hypothetical protein
MEFLGDCRNIELINEIFGSISEFARLCEERGNNFTYGKITIEYNEAKDIHSFYKI